MDLVDAEVGKAQERETERKKRNRRTTLKSYHPQSPSPSPYTSISRPTTPLPLPPIPPTPRTGGLRKLRLPTSRPKSSSPFSALPSAPLRKTSSGELVVGINLPLIQPHGGGGSGGEGGQPVSAGVGKRSFLRPFLLGGGKGGKKVKSDTSDMGLQRPVLAELNHVQRHTADPVLSKEKYQVVDTTDGTEAGLNATPIGDDYLHVELPESPYEETAYISTDDHGPETQGRRPQNLTVQPGPKSLEIAILQEEEKRAGAEPTPMTPIPPRVAELRGDHTTSSPRGSRPGSPKTFHTPGLMADQSPLTPTTVPPTPITAPVTPPSPALTPTSPTSIPPTPVLPVTPINGLEYPIPVQPTSHDRDKPTETRRHRTPPEHESSSRESRSRSKRSDDQGRSKRPQRTDDGGRRHRHRDADDNERRRAKRHERGRSERQVARVQESWLEVLFQDLPFGPDKQIVSHICPE